MKLCDLASVFCEQSIYSCFQWRGGESVFFKTMKRLLVWKPRNLSRVPFLFLEYCFSSAAIKPKLDIFFKKEKLKKKKKTCFILFDRFWKLAVQRYWKQQAEVQREAICWTSSICVSANLFGSLCNHARDNAHSNPRLTKCSAGVGAGPKSVTLALF